MLAPCRRRSAALLASCILALAGAPALAQTICGEWDIPANRPWGTVVALCDFQGLTHLAGTIGGFGGQNIARWDGSTFTPMPQPINSQVTCMAVYDDGTGGGPALYVGGNSWQFGTTVYSGVIRWSGTAWSGTGFPQPGVDALAVADDGTGGGPALYAVTSSGGTSLRRFTGGPWSAVAGAPPGIHAVASFDDGAGRALYIGGDFAVAGGIQARGIVRLRASVWSDVGGGVTFSSGGPGSVRCLSVLDLGEGPALYAGGFFNRAGAVPCFCIAAWQGGGAGAWRGFPFTGYTQFLVQNPGVTSLGAVGNPGHRLLLAGAPYIQSYPGGELAGGLLVWDGARWAGAGDPASTAVYAILTREDPVTPRVIVAGQMPGSVAIARWSPCPDCYPNCDRSTTAPTLNVADFTCFLQKFSDGAGLPAGPQLGHYANCDRSTAAPTLNVADFTCFLQRFAAGCP